MTSGSVTTPMLNAASLNRIANRHLGKRDQFLTIPQDSYLNEDGSYTILFEENLMRTRVYSSVSRLGMNRTSVKIFLNDVAATHYAADGPELGAFYIPQSQQVLSPPGVIYYSFREEAVTSLSWGAPCKSLYCLNGKYKDYVFMNDIERNQKRIDDKKKVMTIVGLGTHEAFGFCSRRKGKTVPKRQLVFPDKEGKKEHDMALFNMQY